VYMAMDPLTISAAAGMRARLESLDLLSNNIANASTAGFKADRDAFIPWESSEALSGFPDPTASPDLVRHWTDHSQGPLTRTGEGLDFAISGRGMFAIETPDGTRYSRNGALQINKQGKLQTADGHLVRVRPPDGREFKLNPALPVEVTASGEVRQESVLQGTIEVYDFDSLDSINKQGGNYFRIDLSGVTAKLASNFEVKQGYAAKGGRDRR
jgi:flagellar basal-body rod protein FlgF